MLRVILVDDERLARQGLRRLLAAHPEVEILGEASRTTAASELFATENPDAVFLDIEMPGADGFDLLSRIGPAAKVVFVTAHAEHAVRAFAVHAVDYLLKPVRPERLADAVGRLRAVCGKEQDCAPYRTGDRICLHTPQRTVVAPLADVLAIEADGDFARYHVAGQASILLCKTLANCERTLPSPPFLRISRSLIVNLDRIRAIEHRSRDSGSLLLNGLERTFRLGRRALGRLKTSRQTGESER